MTEHESANFRDNFLKNLRNITSTSIEVRESEISKTEKFASSKDGKSKRRRYFDESSRAIRNLQRIYKRQGNSLSLNLLNKTGPNKSLNSDSLKPYSTKQGDEAVLHELDSFPIVELRQKFGTKIEFDENADRKPKKSGYFVHKFQEVNSWTNDHEKINFCDEMSEACFKILDMGKTRYFDLCRVVDMCNKFGFTFGNEYVAMVKEVFRGGNEPHHKCQTTFIMFKNIKCATIGGYFLGGLASKNCFWKQWGSSPFIWDQFEMPNGDDSTYHLNWEKADIWVSKTQTALDKFYLTLKSYNMGKLRSSMHVTKWKYSKMMQQIGLKSMHVTYDSLPGHFSSCLNPRLSDNQFAIPHNDRIEKFMKKIKNGDYVMHNQSRAPIKFWRSYNDKKAKEQVKKHNDIADKKNSKFSDGNRTSKMRRINKNGLAEVSLSNNFLRPSDVNYIIHDGVVNALQHDLWLKFVPEELFIHYQLVVELKTPAAQIKMRANTSLEEYEEMVMLVNAGMSTSEPVMQLFHGMKQKTIKLDEERKRENRFLANFMQKIGNVDKTDIALQSKNNPCINFRQFFMVKNNVSGNKVLGHNMQIANISQLFDAINDGNTERYNALKRELDDESKNDFNSNVKKIKMDDILQGKPICSTPILSEESFNFNFKFPGKHAEDMETDVATSSAAQECDLKSTVHESTRSEGLSEEMSDSNDDVISFSNCSSRHVNDEPTLEGDSSGGSTFSRDTGSRAENETLGSIDFENSLFLDSTDRIRRSDLGGLGDLVEKLEKVGNDSVLQNDSENSSLNNSSSNSSSINLSDNSDLEKTKVSEETGTFKTPVVAPAIRLNDDLSVILEKVNWNEFQSNRRRAFMSNGSFGTNLIEKFSWRMKMVPDFKNQFKRQLVTAKGDRIKWHALLVGYSCFVNRILFALIESTTPGDDIREELQALARAVRLFQTANDDRAIFTSLKNSKKGDEFGEYGIKAVPVVTEVVYNTVLEALKIISKQSSIKFVFPHNSTAFVKRVSEIEKGRIQVTFRGQDADRDNEAEKEKERAEGMIIADRQYFFPGDEIQEQFELSNINFQSISNHSIDPLFSSLLNSQPSSYAHPHSNTGNFDFERILNRSSLSENSNVYPDLTVNENQSNNILRVDYSEDNDFKTLLDPIKTPVLSSLRTTSYESANIDLWRDPACRISNEKVDFKVGNHIFHNPQLPKKHELKISLGEENLQINLDEVEPKKSSKKILPLCITYANINPNVQIKLNKFVKSFPFASFFCASELRCKRSDIRSGEAVPLAYYGFTHKTERVDERVHSCVIVRSCFRKDCSIIYEESPFTIIKYKHKNTSVAIGAFYIPPGDSNVWREELNMSLLERRLSEVGKILSRIPCVIFADINVDKTNLRGTRDRVVWNVVNEKLGHLKRHKTGKTYFKSDNHSATTIDYMWTRNLDEGTLNLFGGREYIGNDGHSVFEYSTKETIPGLIGTTKINRRPKLDPVRVHNLGKLYYPHLKEKLDEIENRWKRELGFNENTSLFNKNLNPGLIDKPDNEYCELAFKFLEELFGTLQPDNIVEVEIYNNNKVYGSEVTRITNLLGNLESKKRLALENNENTDLLCRAIERFNRLLDKYKLKDERKSTIGTSKVSDLNIFQIAKIKRPKLRETATDREIFEAEALASEFKRLYKTITEHVKNGKASSIDITELIPDVRDDDKFSFQKWLPTWKKMPIRMIRGKIKTIEQCFNSLKPVTRGLNSSLFRDCIKMLPVEYLPIIESMIIYWANFGNYPDCFLTGKLKPILKKGDINLIKNRRFISVGNMFQQLLGKTIASCLLEYVEHMKILDDRQYGFRAGRSCELAVANLIYKAKARLDNVVTRIIFLDLSSAFFCVKKDELLRVLAKFVNKETLLCIEKMLLPRKAVVISDGIESEPFDIEDIGVPQGEACSPLFFILIINGIFKHVSKRETEVQGTDFQGFADDSQLELYSNIMKELEDLTAKGWEKTKEYVEAVGFKINPSKSEGLHFGPTEKVKKLGQWINTCDGNIEVKKELKFLGLWIDNNLSFKPQYEHVIKKMKTVRAIVYDLIGMGTSRQIIKVAISKAAGIYLYGLGIQPKWTETQYKTLQSLIKDIIKCVYDVKFNGFKEVSQLKLLRKANWMPVKIQHGRAALMTLNRVIMNERLTNLQKVIKEHIFFDNYDEFIPSENNQRIPKIVKDRYKNKGTKVGSAFPVSVKFWFDKLPDFIKIKLGTKDFRKMVTAYCRILCWHRKDSECRHCDEFNINEDLDSFTTYEKMIRALCIQNNLNENELDIQLENETESFLELVEIFNEPDDLIQEMREFENEEN